MAIGNHFTGTWTGRLLSVGVRKTLDAVKDRYYEALASGRAVGIACGMLITALHHAGLATLTHTPSPMKFLGKILGRPENERPYLLLPVGYPAEGCEVPVIEKKDLDDVLVER